MSDLLAERLTPSIQQYGDTYVAACIPSEKKRLRNDVNRIADHRNPENAWQVIHTMLCRDDKGAGGFIIRHMPKTIVLENYALGDEESMRVTSTPALLIQKKAWGATIEESNDIAVNYIANEACLGTFTIRYNGRGWLVIKIKQICD